MGLARSFLAETDLPNQTALSWLVPIGFNNTNDELIITKTITHFPSELYNAAFPTKATDSRPVEIFRGSTIVGIDTGTISVSGGSLTDTSATFPTVPNLAGRLIRDSSSKVHKIISNTSTTINSNSSSISNGKYVILPDFPTAVRTQTAFEFDIRTVAGQGFISNLVVIANSVLTIKTFVQDELVNMMFVDAAGTRFIVKSNDSTTLYFYETTITPVLGVGTKILTSFVDSQPSHYIDSFLTLAEADSRVGTGLLDNQFYYYTIFTLEKAKNVARAEYSPIDSGTPTQAYALSTKNNQFGQLLYNLWPELYRTLDTTEDLEDLMEVFGFQFNGLHSLITTYRLQDTHSVLTTALLPLSEQTGLPSIGYSIGADTLRRVAKDMIPVWKLKGSKEGIALFIREITTWDITQGTADYGGAIVDVLPNVEALRFFDANLGSTNTRLTQTDPFVSGGRFAKSLPGIIIPGFFNSREFVINIPNVALFVGLSEQLTTGSNTTTLVDNTKNYGPIDGLVGNYIIPNQAEVNDIFKIIANTTTTITMQGLVNNKEAGGQYAILSPLNTNRFIVLNRLMPSYSPFGTLPGYNFE
jgi:hypothetical protein